MKKNFILALIIFTLFFLQGFLNGENLNSEKSYLSNTNTSQRIMKLKLKKILTINSSSIGESIPPLFTRARKSLEQNMILIQSVKPGLGIYKFDNKGSLKSRFLAKGEGPGELRYLDSFQIVRDTIIAKSDTKIITYDINCKLMEENTLDTRTYFCHFVDKNQFICNITEWDDSRDPIRHLVMLHKDKDGIVTSFCKNDKRRDIGATMVLLSNGAKSIQYHNWITPDYRFVFLPGVDHLVYGLSDDNNLYLKDLNGKIIKTRKINFTKKMITEKERSRLIESFKSIKRYPDLYKGIIKKIPKNLFTIMDLKLLPNDHLAVFLAIGLQKYKVKIFDKDLTYLYDIQFPENFISEVGSLGRISFFRRGIFFIKNSDDESCYIEYHILNLKNIFV